MPGQERREDRGSKGKEINQRCSEERETERERDGLQGGTECVHDAGRREAAHRYWLVGWWLTDKREFAGVPQRIMQPSAQTSGITTSGARMNRLHAGGIQWFTAAKE